MTIYSTMPLELIFAGIEEQKNEYEHVHVNGLEMQVERMNANEAKIVRIFTTNLNDYLNPDYYPGKVITLTYK